MLRNWISIVLLCSFLRLQLVCSCGVVGYCHPPTDLPVHGHRDAGAPVLCHGCSHSFEQNRGARACQSTRAELAAASTQPSHHESKLDTASHRESPMDSECPYCDRSDDERHHHRFWMFHGNVMPTGKASLKSLLHSASTPLTKPDDPLIHSVGQQLGYHREYLPRANLLALLGHWRI